MGNPSSPESSAHSSVRHVSTIDAAIAHCAEHCNHAVLSRGFVPTRLLYVGADEDADVRVVATDTLAPDDANLPGNHDNVSDERYGNEKIRNKDKYRYAALSYCWGPPADAKTQCTITTSTLASRQVGISREELSPILLDAIIVTRRLGLSYLWIDSLCILQDDLADWEAESAVMGRIYSNAWVTIVGLGSTSCRAGFLNGRWSDLQLLSRASSSCPETSAPEEAVTEDGRHCEKDLKSHSDKQLRVHEALAQICVGPLPDNRQFNQSSSMGVFNATKSNGEPKKPDAPQRWQSPSHESVDAPSAWEFASAMSKSRWSTRGWTFQEKALSTRLLYFDATNIHLRCANFTFREGKRGPLLKKQLAFLEPFDTMGNANVVARQTERTDGEVVEELLESWRNIFIPRFATCEFSRRDDNLPAISGLASYGAEVSGYRYAAGLWVEDLWREVVWYGSGRGRLGSRKSHLSSVLGSRCGFSDLIDWLNDRDEYIAPSWSWAREGGGMARLDFLDIPAAMTTTTDRGGVDVAATFDVKVELKGLNPYGQVTGGELAITSRVLPLLPEEYIKDSSGFEMDWAADVDCGLPDGLDMVLIGSYDANVWMGPGLEQLQRRAYGLVVYPSSVIPGKYYRVGMFSRPEVNTGLVDCEKAEQRTTVII